MCFEKTQLCVTKCHSVCKRACSRFIRPNIAVISHRSVSAQFTRVSNSAYHQHMWSVTECVREWRTKPQNHQLQEDHSGYQISSVSSWSTRQKSKMRKRRWGGCLSVWWGEEKNTETIREDGRKKQNNDRGFSALCHCRWEYWWQFFVP